jgi:hypothetical protein
MDVREGRFSMTPQITDWRHLAAQASDEKDPNKLMELVGELDRLLEREEKSCKQQH